MASDLFAIGSSGLKAARAGLEVTSQNIANAATEGYVRRSVSLAEMAAAGGYSRLGDLSLSGVRVAGIQRNADVFRQAEMRRTGADAARVLANGGMGFDAVGIPEDVRLIRLPGLPGLPQGVDPSRLLAPLEHDGQRLPTVDVHLLFPESTGDPDFMRGK